MNLRMLLIGGVSMMAGTYILVARVRLMDLVLVIVALALIIYGATLIRQWLRGS
mgnify:CR=1 FL=1